MSKLTLIFILLGLSVAPAAFARKISCGVVAHDKFELSQKVVQGDWYKRERSMRGNLTTEYSIIPLGQESAYAIRFEIERFHVQVIIQNLKTEEIIEQDLGSIKPKDTVYGQIFSNEFKVAIDPITFNDEAGKPQVIKELSGKCKLEKFYLGDWVPVP